jgi:hypothetical protein
MDIDFEKYKAYTYARCLLVKYNEPTIFKLIKIRSHEYILDFGLLILQFFYKYIYGKFFNKFLVQSWTSILKNIKFTLMQDAIW